MKTFNLTASYSGYAETWDEIRNDAENEKIKNVFIGTKEFVSVVRCKDCVHKDVPCPLYGGSQFFCAYGERENE